MFSIAKEFVEDIIKMEFKVRLFITYTFALFWH
jgi:hypothetical protein